MRPWHILGAGAIGSLISYRMQQAQLPFTLLQHHAGKSQRLLIDGPTHTRLDVAALNAMQPKSIERLLLTTKAGQVMDALRSAAPYLSAHAVIVSTANGLGFDRAFSEVLPGHHLHRAISTAGAFRDSTGAVHAVSDGITRIGLPGATGNAPDWFTSSLSALKAWRWETDINTAIGEKFSINCVINPLTASLECRNGELLTDDKARNELTALCLETEPALRALGLWRAPQDLLTAAGAVCQSTAQNQSSMLQDHLAHRPTEINFLNGELIRRACSLGFSLPLNTALVNALR